MSAASTSSFAFAQPTAMPSDHPPLDRRELGLHLEICRLQAELELLEDRIAVVRAAGDSSGEVEVAAPFAGRAEELVERMVVALREAGEEEITALVAQGRRETVSELDDARRRADHILDTARDQLAVALAERNRLVGVSLASGTDVLPVAHVLRQVAAAVPTPMSVRLPAAPVPPRSLPPGAASADAPAESAERDRTDAAFDVWMAVAPPLPSGGQGLEEVPAAGGSRESAPARSRSGWVLPLEVLGALLAAVLVVVSVLVLVG